MLDIDVLRTFVAIADTGSFSSAANAVFRTPSAVSMQIKKLEEQLGVAVFDRDARSVTLTGDGNPARLCAASSGAQSRSRIEIRRPNGHRDRAAWLA